jgi:hypothetical protein
VRPQPRRSHLYRADLHDGLWAGGSLACQAFASLWPKSRAPSAPASRWNSSPESARARSAGQSNVHCEPADGAALWGPCKRPGSRGSGVPGHREHHRGGWRVLVTWRKHDLTCRNADFACWRVSVVLDLERISCEIPAESGGLPPCVLRDRLTDDGCAGEQCHEVGSGLAGTAVQDGTRWDPGRRPPQVVDGLLLAQNQIAIAGGV